MDRIIQLKLNKNFKEFEYLQSEYDYRKELISIIDVDFIKSVSELISKFPELKEIYEKRTQQKIDDLLEKIKIKEKKSKEIVITEDIIDNIDVVEQEVNIDINNDKIKIKNLYRSVVKATHPDKVTDAKLNEIYIQATKFYEECDLHNLYRLCDQLNIIYEMEESDIQELDIKISSLKQQLNFMEGTYTWKWHQIGRAHV